MFDARLTAPRFTLATLFITAAWIGAASAQSTDTANEQWRPAGITRPVYTHSAASAAASSANQTWRLPNSQQPVDNDQRDDDGVNPLRQKEKQPSRSSANPPEPRAFEPPTHAMQIAARPPAATRPSTQQSQQHSQSAAVAQAPSAIRHPTGVRSVAHGDSQSPRRAANAAVPAPTPNE